MRSRGPVSTLADEWATVEGVVAKGFTSKSGNTLLNIGAAYPNQTFTDWLSRVGAVAPHFGQTPWNRLGVRLAKCRCALCGRTGKAKRRLVQHLDNDSGNRNKNGGYSNY